MRWVLLAALAVMVAGCEGSVRGNALQFKAAREAYMSCAHERGAANCQAERDVMFAAAHR